MPRGEPWTPEGASAGRCRAPDRGPKPRPPFRVGDEGPESLTAAGFWHSPGNRRVRLASSLRPGAGTYPLTVTRRNRTRRRRRIGRGRGTCGRAVSVALPSELPGRPEGDSNPRPTDCDAGAPCAAVLIYAYSRRGTARNDRCVYHSATPDSRPTAGLEPARACAHPSLAKKPFRSPPPVPPPRRREALIRSACCVTQQEI